LGAIGVVTNEFTDVYKLVRDAILNALDVKTFNTLSDEALLRQLQDAVSLLLNREGVSVTQTLQEFVSKNLFDELKGFGPIQSLMDDANISDIMINGPNDIFIERNGLIEKSNVSFIDNSQLNDIAKRIAGSAGRRVDELSPLCDARMSDGSRINIVLSPIAIDGTSISIRKFKEDKLGLQQLVEFGAMNNEMAQMLMIATRCRLNIIVSGGTGSGKTTMMGALSKYIIDTERIVTIEDAAELQLQQSHVVRLETRPDGIEGSGGIDPRRLVINSLRMRPDRVIIGECRGPEAFEMLQAMNTGHDGSMTTLHANTPRDAISRIESMVMMATSSLPLEAIRRTIVSAVDLVVQVSRLHDGSRKTTCISEIIGLEGSQVVMEDIFTYESDGKKTNNKLIGKFVCNGLMKRSKLYQKAQMFGLEEQLSSILTNAEME
jgi:pilus assembly protein CpaF